LASYRTLRYTSRTLRYPEPKIWNWLASSILPERVDVRGMLAPRANPTTKPKERVNGSVRSGVWRVYLLSEPEIRPRRRDRGSSTEAAKRRLHHNVLAIALADHSAKGYMSHP